MNFGVPPPEKRTIVWTTVIVLALPAVVAAPALAGDIGGKGLIVALGAAFAIGALLVFLQRRRGVALEGRTLIIKGAIYTRRRHVDAIDLERARVVDLDERSELRPMLRTNGYSLPGLHMGHYRLRDRRKAFCVLTSRRGVVALPEREGKLILVSVERPQALLDALRSRATSRSGS